MSISWTTSARRDVNAIWDFIEQQNPNSAEMVESSVLRSVEGLLQFPRKGRPGRVKGPRELVVPGLPYIVVYWLVDSSIVILRVLHGAQDWPI